jgi:hypothetical protein
MNEPTDFWRNWPRTGRATAATWCETIQLYAEVQQRLDDFEENPRFEEMMKRSAEDIRAGRAVSHEEAKRRARRRRS